MNDTIDKPLEKMTAKELREMAAEMPEITGAHGMEKEELIKAIKEVKGIVDEVVTTKSSAVGELKEKIKALKTKRQAAIEAKDKKMATMYRRQIARLKKKTRKAA